MKRILSAIGVILLAVAVLSAPVYALVKADDTIIVKVGEVIDDDLYAAGSEVIIEGTVNGDVYVGANRLVVRGTVNGDVIAGANTIEITGVIRDDLRVAGNTISLVGATIGDSVTVGGNELSIDRDSVVGGGLQFGGRLLSLDGSVGRGIVSGNQTTRVDAPVGKSIKVASENITIGENAIVQGDLDYKSDNEAVIEGEVLGEINQTEGLDINTQSLMKWTVVGFNGWAFLSALVIGGVMMLIFPTMFRRSQSKFMKKPWPTVGWGAVALLAAIPAMILISITVIGIPLAMIMFVLWVLAILLAKFLTSYLVGYSLIKYAKKADKKYEPNAYWALGLGLAAYYLLRMIPIVGMFVRLGTTIVGLGLLLTLYSRPKTKKTASTKTS